MTGEFYLVIEDDWGFVTVLQLEGPGRDSDTPYSFGMRQVSLANLFYCMRTTIEYPSKIISTTQPNANHL
jgi:hypothetical protein